VYSQDQTDTDNDALGDICDNCPATPNLHQEDTDNSGIGDACNDAIDADGDEWEDNIDNCPANPNPFQDDSYPPYPRENGIGDACDCEGNFNCSEDQDVDGSDAVLFKRDFGRSTTLHPCVAGDTCNGDFTCDGDVDGTDASLFKSDFGRSSIQNPCPVCVQGEWCGY
jgi:syndecan 4